MFQSLLPVAPSWVPWVPGQGESRSSSSLPIGGTSRMPTCPGVVPRNPRMVWCRSCKKPSQSLESRSSENDPKHANEEANHLNSTKQEEN